MRLTLGGRGTKSQVSFWWRAESSSCIAVTHPGCFSADLTDFGSVGTLVVAKKYFGLGLTIPCCSRVTIGWALVEDDVAEDVGGWIMGWISDDWTIGAPIATCSLWSLDEWFWAWVLSGWCEVMVHSHWGSSESSIAVFVVDWPSWPLGDGYPVNTLDHMNHVSSYYHCPQGWYLECKMDQWRAVCNAPPYNPTPMHDIIRFSPRASRFCF